MDNQRQIRSRWINEFVKGRQPETDRQIDKQAGRIWVKQQLFQALLVNFAVRALLMDFFVAFQCETSDIHPVCDVLPLAGT